MDEPRYNSGTALNRTKKEERIDSLEHIIGEMSDELYIGLKRLTIPQLRELYKLVHTLIR